MNIDDFDALLNMDDPDFARKLAEAIGIAPGETVQVVTPQFERTDGITPSLPDAWDRLRALDATTLRAIGCGVWDEPDESGAVLMLFPKEWYPHIPAGFIVEDINGEREAFVPGETDDDCRFGCLAYGVRVRLEAGR